MADPKRPNEEFEGYDEEQDAEIHEYEGGGPTDGTILTDMTRDRPGDDLERQAPEGPDRIVTTEDMDLDEDSDEATERP